MKELKNDIKRKSFKRLYLLFGDERYLVTQFMQSLQKAALEPGAELMNLDVFAGKDCSVDSLINSAQTAAFLSDYRLVVIKDSGLFAQGRKDDSEKLAAFLPDIPEGCILLISESNVDKRGRLYKKAAGIGHAVEFKRQSEGDIITWLQRGFAKEGKELSAENAALMLRTTMGDMGMLANEAQKLLAYQSGNIIESADIEAVCTKSPEAKIFELVAAVGNKDARRALDIFNNMLLLKESPIMVLSMIARQLRIILQCKYLYERGMASDEIAAELSQRGFTVKQCLSQARNFSVDGLITALKSVLDADVDIKTGKRGDKLAVEVLIFELVALA